MGGSWKDALEVPIETKARFIQFADIEQDINNKRAEANASTQQQ